MDVSSLPCPHKERAKNNGLDFQKSPKQKFPRYPTFPQTSPLARDNDPSFLVRTLVSGPRDSSHKLCSTVIIYGDVCRRMHGEERIDTFGAKVCRGVSAQKAVQLAAGMWLKAKTIPLVLQEGAPGVPPRLMEHRNHGERGKGKKYCKASRM